MSTTQEGGFVVEFNREWVERVPAPPKRSLDSPTYVNGMSRLEERGQSELSAVWYWTSRISEELPRLEEQLSSARAVTRLAAGFIEELGGEFGIIVYSESLGDATSDSVGGVSDTAPRSITIDTTASIVIRESTVDQHSCTAPEVAAPTVARATCWVRCTARNYEGWPVPRQP